MKKILLIDNYDSFTYNLAHLLEETGEVELLVVRNKDIPQNVAADFDGVLLSPGPGIPKEAGELLYFLEQNVGKISIFGVCLGHQAIAEALGASLENMKQVYHGVSANVKNLENQSGILKDLGSEFQAGRYHSWVVNEDSLPKEMKVTATIDDGTIMAMEHNTLPLYGVQFHPESILTPGGKQIIQNWLNSIAA